MSKKQVVNKTTIRISIDTLLIVLVGYLRTKKSNLFVLKLIFNHIFILIKRGYGSRSKRKILFLEEKSLQSK